VTLVLVVDDDPSVRTIVQTWLEPRGIDLLVVDSAPTDTGNLERLAVDLAIIDICMPDMNCLQIVRTFSQRTPRVPVIAMSGFSSYNRRATEPDFLRMAGSLGAAFCLRKPFRPDRLLAAIGACLDAPHEEARHEELRHEEPRYEERKYDAARHALVEISSGALAGGSTSADAQPASEALT
jgi:CheY-like chemotaxis protein